MNTESKKKLKMIVKLKKYNNKNVAPFCLIEGGPWGRGAELDIPAMCLPYADVNIVALLQISHL